MMTYVENPRPIVDSFEIVWEYDEFVDLSYLEQDYEDCSEEERIKYKKEDKERLDNYGKTWEMMFCRAEAVVSYSIGGNSYRIQKFQSGGIHGIESDSDENYKKEVEKEQLYDLKKHLERFNIDTSNIII